jgi:hypothetical protein
VSLCSKQLTAARFHACRQDVSTVFEANNVTVHICKLFRDIVPTAVRAVSKVGLLFLNVAYSVSCSWPTWLCSRVYVDFAAFAFQYCSRFPTPRSCACTKAMHYSSNGDFPHSRESDPELILKLLELFV